MSENLSFFEEQSSDMPMTKFTDLLAQPSWQDFCNEAKQVEREVAMYDPNNDDDCIEVGKYIDILTERLGEEHQLKQCKITGMGYQIYGKSADAIDGEPSFVNTTSAVYHGVNICRLKGEWKVTLEFYCPEQTDEVSHGDYSFPPDPHHILTLNMHDDDHGEYEDEDDLDLVANLHNDFSSVQAFVYNKDFAATPAVGQRMMLSDITAAANDEVPHEFQNRDVVIECTSYYTAYDEMHYATYDDATPGFDLRDFLTDQSDMPTEERRALKGTIIGFEYPELSTLPPDYPLSGGALDMNNGSYCLVLRSEDGHENATHYVLPQTISGIY